MCDFIKTVLFLSSVLYFIPLPWFSFVKTVQLFPDLKGYFSLSEDNSVFRLRLMCDSSSLCVNLVLWIWVSLGMSHYSTVYLSQIKGMEGLDLLHSLPRFDLILIDPSPLNYSTWDIHLDDYEHKINKRRFLEKPLNLEGKRLLSRSDRHTVRDRRDVRGRGPETRRRSNFSVSYEYRLTLFILITTRLCCCQLKGEEVSSSTRGKQNRERVPRRTQEQIFSSQPVPLTSSDLCLHQVEPESTFPY